MKKPKFEVFPDYDEVDPEEQDKPIRRGYIKRKGVGLIPFDEYEDHADMWCPHCDEAGFRVKLGPKILMPNEERAEDYENWIQCTDCYNIYAIHEVEKGKNLVITELEGHVVENPNEAKKTIIENIPKRTSPAGKKAAAKRKKERYGPHHKDADIQREIRQYGEENVHIIQDTDP